ncbi:MAG: hypothetical protein H7A36_05295 [Chlamydiales bacterium]|nr:hypothetical protein [Chlamydiales bacterium]
MGIGKEAYKFLLGEKKRGNLEGEALLSIGRPCIQFTEKVMKEEAHKQGISLVDTPFEVSFDDHWSKFHYIDDKMLFKALGFSRVESTDNSSFEGAEFVHDMNVPLPKEHWNQYDLIIDAGTAEHIFHFPQYLENLHNLLRVGGKILFMSPTNNYVDHGFYMFCPQVYHTYFSVNKYDIVTAEVVRHDHNPLRQWERYRYVPGVLDELSIGGFSKKQLGVHFLVRKRADSTAGVIPQQGLYEQCWDPSLRPKKLPLNVNPIHRLGISINKKLKRRFHVWRLFLAKRKLEKLRIR